MQKAVPLVLILSLFFSSCNGKRFTASDDGGRIKFLSSFGVVVDTGRPYYNSSGWVPEIMDTTWEIRDLLSKEVLKTSITKYKGKECSIYMYPVSKLPFSIKNVNINNVRAAIVCCKDSIVCSYIEIVSELKALPPMALNGKSIADLSNMSWDNWKAKIDDDDNKQLVIWQYYEALRSGNYSEAYKYIYSSNNIKEDEFIKAAGKNMLPYMDFISMEQYKKPRNNECFYIIKALVRDGKGNGKQKIFEIIFDLKRDPSEEDFGGWKIFSTKVK